LKVRGTEKTHARYDYFYRLREEKKGTGRQLTQKYGVGEEWGKLLQEGEGVGGGPPIVLIKKAGDGAEDNEILQIRGVKGEIKRERILI